MKKYKKLLFWFIPGTLFFVGAYYFLNRDATTQQNAINFTADMKGSDNKGKLGFLSDELNSQTLLAGILCVNRASNVDRVDLFMPNMGHGSSPPVLSKSLDTPAQLNLNESQKNDYGCFNISKIEMFMPGLWQVRVFYKTGDVGIFEVNLTQ